MMQCLIFLFITGVAQLNGLPYAEKTADYYNDDYNYSSDDYPNGDGDDNTNTYPSETEKIIHRTPVMKSKNSDELINEGNIIRLSCVVDNIDGFVFMWYKGSKMIAFNDQLTEKNRRMKLVKAKNRNTIEISNAEPSDAGNYICKVSANKPVQVEHKIQIRVAPAVESVPANGQMIVMEGEPATLQCNLIRGSPEPEIKWRRKARHFADGNKEMTGSRITFAKATRHHSGIYNCSADNGYSPMPPGAHKLITLDVQHKPTIEVEETFIHTLKDDHTTEIVCIVHASPSATVTWMKNGEAMSEKKQFGLVKKVRNRHTLSLPTDILGESKFGVYTCTAKNEHGSDAKHIEVSGKAGAPHFKSHEEGTEEHTYSLEWVTESKTPIIAFKLKYREDDGDRSFLKARMPKSYYSYTTESEMSNIIEDSSDKRSIRDENEWKTIEDVGEPISNGDNMYTGHYTFKGLRPRSNYVVMVSSQNQYGWSRPSNSSYMFFGTKGAVPLAQRGGASSLQFKLTTIIISILSISLYSRNFQLAFSS